MEEEVEYGLGRVAFMSTKGRGLIKSTRDTCRDQMSVGESGRSIFLIHNHNLPFYIYGTPFWDDFTFSQISHLSCEQILINSICNLFHCNHAAPATQTQHWTGGQTQIKVGHQTIGFFWLNIFKFYPKIAELWSQIGEILGQLWAKKIRQVPKFV